MPVVRNRLNNRRQVSTVSLVWPPFSGSRYHVTVGEYEDGRPGEVWVHGAKVGSEIDALLDDASILMSVLIQVGYDTEDIKHSLGREFTGSQVIYYRETAQGVEVKMVVQEPFTEGEGTDIDSEMELCWAPEETVMLGRRDGQRQ